MDMKLQVLSTQDDYPGGSIMPGRSYNANGYRYGFNGHEKVDEVHGVTGSWLSFGDYGYDTRIGRRPSPDPHQIKYPSISPYAGFNDNPIYFIDTDGKDVYVFVDEGTANNPGHTMIGVSDFREVEGKMVEFIRIYDLHPSNSDDISGNNSVKGRIDYREIKASDISTFAKDNNSEYVQLKSSPEVDETVNTYLSSNQTEVNSEQKGYKAGSFNCTSLAAEPIEDYIVKDGTEIGNTKLEGKISLGVGTAKLNFYVDSPNHLWNYLIQRKEVVTKSTDKQMDENASQKYLDNANEYYKGE